MANPVEDVGAIGRLLAVVGLLNSDLDLPLVLRRIADAGRDLLNADAAGVVGYSGGQLRVLVGSGFPAGLVDVPVPYEGSGVEALDKAGVDTLVQETAAYPYIQRSLRETGLGLHTLAVTRIVVLGETRGALYVFFAEPGRTVSALDRRMLELLAGHAGAAVSNAEAYAAVVRQQQHERDILDAMADGLAVIDVEHIVRWWNAAATELTGVPADEALGRPLPFPRAVAGVGLEYELPNGRWVEVLGSPLTGTDQTETVVTFRDISASKMVEEAKNLFLATSGHELRTPLTVIRGFTSTLMARWDDLTDGERREAVGIIGVRADGLGALVEQVLQSSHAEAGARRLERRPLDLGPTLTTVAADIGSLSDRHQVTVELPSGLPLVLADDQALRTILGHLIDNAVKYSPAGGVIALSALLSEDGAAVRIRVDDEGIGVSSEYQERVFERFFQADGGDTRHQGGFGLGLYIVRRLVQAHDGTVTMSRRPDGRAGSRVELCLPVAVNSR
jgi:signal transduction histidine kinase